MSMVAGKVIIPFLVYTNFRTYKKNGKEVTIGRLMIPESPKRDSAAELLFGQRRVLVPCYVRDSNLSNYVCGSNMDLRRGRIYMRGGHRR